MVTNRNIDRVVASVRRAVRSWAPPAMDRYRHDPFRTLIGCILSLRTKDETTEGASERLFAKAPDAARLARLRLPAIERAIYPVGFYRTKARTIRDIASTLLERHEGNVPGDFDALLELKGVGRKTANLVVTLAFRKDGICVDTHVHRISNRWGYVHTKTPDQTEMALRKKLPRRHWRTYNDLLVTFGQNLCHPTSPWCSRCPLTKHCGRIGVRRSR